MSSVTHAGEVSVSDLRHHDAYMHCPGRNAGVAARVPNEEALVRVTHWFRSGLPCVAGRREFNQNRYMIRLGYRGRIRSILEEFEEQLLDGAATACFIVFDVPQHLAALPAMATFRHLAELMSEASDCDAETLTNGSALSLEFSLACPVTGRTTLYDDFECIAFCPQSSDLHDALYDPLMYAPYPSINISSDVYAFSVFVRDSCIKKFGVEPTKVTPGAALFSFFYDCAQRWHAIAAQTIENFARTVEDKSRCPVHITPDRMHWVASHQDPSFADALKIPHVHELPLLYAMRICDAWVEHFTYRREYCASGLARAGVAVEVQQ